MSNKNSRSHNNNNLAAKAAQHVQSLLLNSTNGIISLAEEIANSKNPTFVSNGLKRLIQDFVPPVCFNSMLSEIIFVFCVMERLEIIVNAPSSSLMEALSTSSFLEVAANMSSSKIVVAVLSEIDTEIISSCVTLVCSIIDKIPPTSELLDRIGSEEFLLNRVLAILEKFETPEDSNFSLFRKLFDEMHGQLDNEHFYKRFSRILGNSPRYSAYLQRHCCKPTEASALFESRTCSFVFKIANHSNIATRFCAADFVNALFERLRRYNEGDETACLHGLVGFLGIFADKELVRGFCSGEIPEVTSAVLTRIQEFVKLALKPLQLAVRSEYIGPEYFCLKRRKPPPCCGELGVMSYNQRKIKSRYLRGMLSDILGQLIMFCAEQQSPPGVTAKKAPGNATGDNDSNSLDAVSLLQPVKQLLFDELREASKEKNDDWFSAAVEALFALLPRSPSSSIAWATHADAAELMNIALSNTFELSQETEEMFMIFFHRVAAGMHSPAASEGGSESTNKYGSIPLNTIVSNITKFNDYRMRVAIPMLPLLPIEHFLQSKQQQQFNLDLHKAVLKAFAFDPAMREVLCLQVLFEIFCNNSSKYRKGSSPERQQLLNLYCTKPILMFLLKSLKPDPQVVETYEAWHKSNKIKQLLYSLLLDNQAGIDLLVSLPKFDGWQNVLLISPQLRSLLAFHSSTFQDEQKLEFTTMNSYLPQGLMLFSKNTNDGAYGTDDGIDRLCRMFKSLFIGGRTRLRFPTRFCYDLTIYFFSDMLDDYSKIFFQFVSSPQNPVVVFSGGRGVVDHPPEDLLAHPPEAVFKVLAARRRPSTGAIFVLLQVLKESEWKNVPEWDELDVNELTPEDLLLKEHSSYHNITFLPPIMD